MADPLRAITPVTLAFERREMRLLLDGVTLPSRYDVAHSGYGAPDAATVSVGDVSCDLKTYPADETGLSGAALDRIMTGAVRGPARTWQGLPGRLVRIRGRVAIAYGPSREPTPRVSYLMRSRSTVAVLTCVLAEPGHEKVALRMANDIDIP